MMRKITALLLAVALVFAMWVVPSAAAEFTDTMFFNADYTSGSLVDAVGGTAYEIWKNGSSGAEVPFVEDAAIASKVASFDGSTAVMYGINDVNLSNKLQADFTVEAYIKLDENTTPSGWGLLLGTYWMNTSTGAGIGYNHNDGLKLGTGAGELSYTVGSTGNTSTKIANLATGKWTHIVYVHTGSSVEFYIDGQHVSTQTATQLLNNSPCGFRVGGYNWMGQFATKMECAYVRLYEAIAEGTDVAALYAGRNGNVDEPTDVATEEPTPTPTNTPADEPTEEPTPTPDQNLPVLPDGPDYKVVAEDIPAFKAGDKVDITFKVTDIADPEGILGVDLDIVYDYTLLRPVKNDNGRPVVTSAKSEINSANKGANWDSTTRLDGEDTETPTFVLKLFDDADPYAEEPQTELRIKEDGALWFTISFEAVADATEGAMVAYTSAADGTDHNVDGIKGTGTYVYVGSSTDEPTDTPTGTPTDEPTEPSPSATTPAPGGNDNKPGNTVTFDAGLVSLAAVALSSIVAAKKKRF